MLELDNDNDNINIASSNDMQPIRPTTQEKTVNFSDNVETIGTHSKKIIKETKKSANMPQATTTTQEDSSTAISASKYKKAKTKHNPNQAHDKDIQGKTHHDIQTENTGIDDNTGKRKRKRPDFYQAGVNLK